MAEKLETLLDAGATPGGASVDGALDALDAAGKRGGEPAGPGAPPPAPGSPSGQQEPKRSHKKGMGKGKRRGPRSRGELKAELRAAEAEAARIAAERDALLPPEDDAIRQVAASLKLAIGVLGVVLVKALGDHMQFTEGEADTMSEALAVPLAPHYGKLGPAMPWLGAALVVASVLAPKIEKHLELQKAGRVALDGAEVIHGGE